ncbi:MAG: dihydrolipoamide acetyltransferase family protein, partial [Chloroflexota bacterium]|nr:dihydrolipoamide acetyltransferase family protein [Chloroflexota bacterium]
DKAVVEIPAPQAGIVGKLHWAEGDTVKVGAPLVTLLEEGESLPATAPAAPQPGAAPAAPRRGATAVGELEEEGEATARPLRREVLASPKVRRLAQELGVDLARVTGSGAGGVVTEADVRQFSRKGEEARPSDTYGPTERVPLAGMRKVIAEHMALAKRIIPHAAHLDHVEVSHLLKRLEADRGQAQAQGVHLTILSYMIKIVAACLKEHPYLNATMDEERSTIILKKYYNIGVAVDTPDGLIVPVVKGADKKTLWEVAKEIQTLADKARARTLALSDLRGGTFTITNIGFLGGHHAVPIINYPEVAILATGRIQEHPHVHDGKIAIGQILPVSLAFDHRATDGAEVARFVNGIIHFVEHPEEIPVTG